MYWDSWKGFTALQFRSDYAGNNELFCIAPSLMQRSHHLYMWPDSRHSEWSWSRKWDLRNISEVWVNILHASSLVLPQRITCGCQAEAASPGRVSLHQLYILCLKTSHTSTPSLNLRGHSLPPVVFQYFCANFPPSIHHRSLTQSKTKWDKRKAPSCWWQLGVTIMHMVMKQSQYPWQHCFCMEPYVTCMFKRCVGLMPFLSSKRMLAWMVLMLFVISVSAHVHYALHTPVWWKD